MELSARSGGVRGRLFAGKWILERALGRGGMGLVVAARHARLGHRVALKVLGRGLRDQPDLVARFEREARAASAIESPHAVKVHDIELAGDHPPYLVMELLEGCDLGAVLERHGPPPLSCSVRWIVEACDAIAEAHRRGIVHRDIKPSNLFLAVPRVSAPDVNAGSLEPTIKVLDFGIAKDLAHVAGAERGITADLTPLGTPHYMSPEQVRSAREVDARSDVWSLGATLFELLTGEAPFPHDEPYACIAAIVADPVRDPRVLRPDLPSELVAIVMRALAKDPAERYATAAELATALGAVAEAQRDAHPFHVSLPPVCDADVEGCGEDHGVELLGEAERPRVTTIPSLPLTPTLSSRFRRGGLVAAVALVAAFSVLPKCVQGSAGSVALGHGETAGLRVVRAALSVRERVIASAVVSGAATTLERAPASTTVRIAAPRAFTSATPKREPRASSPSPSQPAVHGGLSGPGF